MIKKFAFVGSGDASLAFKAIGADIFVNTLPDQIIKTLKSLDEDYSVVFITQEAANIVLDDLLVLRANSHLAIIVVPTTVSNNDFSIDLLKKDIEQAIGTDAIFNR